MITFLVGNAIDRLAELPDHSVHMCVTSPPYFGLRSYLPATSPEKRHEIGCEKDPQDFIDNLVSVFREVRRVLRPDGTLWVNLGDSYTDSGRGSDDGSTLQGSRRNQSASRAVARERHARPFGLGPKQLLMMPARFAIAMQQDGWILRMDIIWSKRNNMPESVRDRVTKSHEYLFHFAPGQRMSRVVQFADLSSQRVHLGKYLWTNHPDMGSSEICLLLARAVFDGSQRKENFSLPPFYAQEWKQRADGSDTDFVRALPTHHIPAVWSARFLDGDASAEEFMHQLNRLRVALGDGGDFLIGGAPSDELFDSPSIYRDREGTITVHHAGKISQIDFAHERIIVSSTTTCRYYYDAEAIAQPISQGTIDRISQPNLDNQRGSDRAHAGGKTNGTMKAVVRKSGNKERKFRGEYGGVEGSKSNQGFAVPWASDGSHRRQYKRALEIATEGGLTQAHLDAIRIVGLADRSRQETLYGDNHSDPEQLRLAQEAMDVLGAYYREFLAVEGKRNKRSVWSISSTPFKGAHYATFPPKLIEPCILAGTSQEGCCPDCGAPWKRQTERTDVVDPSANGSRFDKGKTGAAERNGDRTQPGERFLTQTVGWKPTCKCTVNGDPLEPTPCTVLDPFGGAGTTGLVCQRLNRRAILIDLNPDNVELSRERIRVDGIHGYQQSLEMP